MGIRIDNVTLDEVLAHIQDAIAKKEKTYIVTPNVDHIVKLQKDEAFRQAYADAGLVVVDGTPIVKAVLDNRFGPARIAAHFGPIWVTDMPSES